MVGMLVAIVENFQGCRCKCCGDLLYLRTVLLEMIRTIQVFVWAKFTLPFAAQHLPWEFVKPC